MDFYEEASLVMVPSGYKDQKVYSSVPDDGSADLTFIRASNATRVNSEGLVEKVRTNLVLSSNNISTQSTYWRANQSGTTTQNAAVAPDGTTTAALITPDGVGTYSGVAVASTITLAAAPYTFSAYLKTNSGTANVTLLVLDSATTFHEVSVTATTTWTRFSVSFTAAAGAAEAFITSAGALAWLAWGAQLETGDIVTNLIPTTSAAVSVGPVSGLPRLDYSGGASCPSLLLEPQRTNVCLWSEQIDNAGWTKINTPTITSNIATAPDGYGGADGIQDTTGGSFKRIRQTFSVSTNSTNTASVFVKKETTQTNFGGVYLTYTGGTSKFAYGIVNPIAGTIVVSSDSVIGATSTKAEDYGDWWRFSLTATDNGSNTSVEVGYYGTLSTNGTTTGIGAGSVRTIWGLQLELGAAYATSYIPTLSSAVTRVADAASKTGISSLIGQTEGTLYGEWTANDVATSGRILAIGDGTFANRIAILEDGGSVRLYISTSSVVQADLTYLSSYTGTHKIAVAYANNDLKVYIDGVAVATQTSLNVPPCSVTYVGTFEDGTGAAPLGGGIKQTLLFKTRLSNADLASLTSL